MPKYCLFYTFKTNIIAHLMHIFCSDSAGSQCMDMLNIMNTGILWRGNALKWYSEKVKWKAGCSDITASSASGPKWEKQMCVSGFNWENLPFWGFVYYFKLLSSISLLVSLFWLNLYGFSSANCSLLFCWDTCECCLDSRCKFPEHQHRHGSFI